MLSNIITKAWFLWFCFIATLLIGASFGLVTRHWEFQLLDAISAPDVISSTLAGYSPGQKEVHIWTTLTLDVAYPLTYGGLFAGLALRAFRGAGKWLSIPAFATILVDLIEGITQVAMLVGAEGLIALKSALTVMKFGFFGVSFLIAIAALAVLLRRRFKP